MLFNLFLEGFQTLVELMMKSAYVFDHRSPLKLLLDVAKTSDSAIAGLGRGSDGLHERSKHLLVFGAVSPNDTRSALAVVFNARDEGAGNQHHLLRRAGGSEPSGQTANGGAKQCRLIIVTFNRMPLKCV